MSRAVKALGIALAGAAFFFLLRNHGAPGGDTDFFFAYPWFDLIFHHYIYYPREPLGHALPFIAYHLVGDPFLGFAIVGALSGGAYLWVLSRFTRPGSKALPIALFWLINLGSVTTLEFIGHVEFYAPLIPALALYFLALTRALEPEPRCGPLAVVAAFMLAYFCHKLSLFFLPSMLFMAFARENGRWVRRPFPRRQWEWALALMIVLLALDLAPGILYVYGPIHVHYFLPNEPLDELITPLTHAMARRIMARNHTGMFFIYTLGEPLHWAYFFGFLLAGAPLGVPMLLARRRALFQSDAALALLTASVCGVIWIFFWHPRGYWKDWDLFCVSGVPINLLAAGLWTSLFTPRAARAAPANLPEIPQNPS